MENGYKIWATISFYGIIKKFWKFIIQIRHKSHLFLILFLSYFEGFTSIPTALTTNDRNQRIQVYFIRPRLRCNGSSSINPHVQFPVHSAEWPVWLLRFEISLTLSTVGRAGLELMILRLAIRCPNHCAASP